MRDAHPIERAVGIEHYVAESPGIGGTVRADTDDFRVRELERFETKPVDASPDAYPHLVFRATLEGWDTNDFARELSNQLGVSRERVSWAGTKDKHAITTQLFSVYGIDPDALPTLNRTTVEVLGRSGRALEFGDLAGNAFEIAVDSPDVTERRTIEDRLASITAELAALTAQTDPVVQRGSIEAHVGVLNFFGQQRFGSQRPITHEVGLEIVRDEWEAAVMAYLGRPSEHEPEDTQEARAFVEETHDWSEALDRFPHRLQYERSMLHALAEHDGPTGPAAFQRALERLPSNLRRLFVHAAQSFVFNRILSRRLEQGLPFDRPVAGDVVCFADRDAPENLELPDTDRLQTVDERRVQSVRRHCERGRAFVTAPLVGTETTLADGEQGAIERAVLEELDLEGSDFDLEGEYNSTGTRRAILVRTPLEIDTDELTFRFSLPKGSYATVVMREYLQTNPLHLG